MHRLSAMQLTGRVFSTAPNCLTDESGNEHYLDVEHQAASCDYVTGGADCAMNEIDSFQGVHMLTRLSCER